MNSSRSPRRLISWNSLCKPSGKSSHKNHVLKFADDTNILGKEDSLTDRDILQRDLQQLLDWSETWQLPFHLQVPGFLHLGRYSKDFLYYIKGQVLESVSEVRDLGVEFTSDLKPSRQCQLAYSTASRVLGMIGRTISYKSRKVMLRLYKSLDIWNSVYLPGLLATIKTNNC